MFLMFLDVVSIVNEKNYSKNDYASSMVSFNTKDYYAIKVCGTKNCNYKTNLIRIILRIKFLHQVVAKPAYYNIFY